MARVPCRLPVLPPLAAGDGVEVPEELTGVVGVGSTVCFMIGANGFDTFDSTDLAATISQAPEPFGALLLALGLVMLCFRRR